MCATHHEIAHHASYVSLSQCPSLLPSPMGRLLTRLPRLRSAHCLQGGGVYVGINSGIVTISSSSIYGNYAGQNGGGVYVNMQHGGAGTVSIVNCRVYSNQAYYVRASHACKTPSPYFTCFALVLAVRWRCQCLLRHSHD
jgi:hypothetical protein